MTTTLRPVRDEDHDALFAWQCDPAGIRMAAFTREDPSDRAAFDAHQHRVRTDPAIRHRAVERDGVLVGTVAAFTMEGDREVTYWVDPAHWGEGIATDALRLLVAEEPERPLFGRTAVHNTGSRRVLEKCGFVVVGEDSGWAHGVGAQTAELVLRLDA
ncbi:GNAT family N-acetyltransferase [Phycicoccus sonneratiae]|uniref:GNAT family N-acetyltransferase n=1 Tax=Phycicoccus sonneratiae TaxID=2807628 RepID=A0ABS2CIM4_9MICO|nr:GNAT family N-acetyltransferase [Phycicoccus sonneraticus]MBM6398964.1 GNAT family N-acetyltransferase [Phycicoccus sonneraticus]